MQSQVSFQEIDSSISLSFEMLPKKDQQNLLLSTCINCGGKISGGCWYVNMYKGTTIWWHKSLCAYKLEPGWLAKVRDEFGGTPKAQNGGLRTIRNEKGRVIAFEPVIQPGAK